jgi:hypothetical protein
VPGVSLLPTRCDIDGVAGDPKALLLTLTLEDSFGNPLPWSDLTGPVAVVDNPYGVPTITSPASGQLLLSWTGSQTSMLGGYPSIPWALQATILDVEGTLLSGDITMYPSTGSAPPGPTTLSAAVSVGTVNVALAITVTGNGISTIANWAGDSTIDVGGNPGAPALRVHPGTFVGVAGAQTISGAKTFGVPVLLNGGAFDPKCLAYYGEPNGTDDTSTFATWLSYLTANPGLRGILSLVPGAYRGWKITNVNLASAVGLLIDGEDTPVTIIGTESTHPYRGFQLSGTGSDIHLRNLNITGSGNVADLHAGVWSSSNATLSHVSLEHVNVAATVVGIYLDILSTGVINDVTVELCRLLGMVGAATGQGYGIAASSGVTNEVIRDNYIEAAARHSIYVSAPPAGHVAGTPDPNGIIVSGNRIVNHRIGQTQASSPLPALNISRTQNVQAHDNIIVNPYDVGIQVQQDPPIADGAFDAWAVSIHDNQVIEPIVPAGAAGLAGAILLGTSISTAGAVGLLKNVTCRDNLVLINGQNCNGIRLQNGLHMRVLDNDVQILNAVAVDACILVDALGFPTSSNDYDIRGNQMTITDGSAGATGISLTVGAATSGLTARFDNNKISAPAATRLWAAASVTAAQNMIFTRHNNYTNLTFSPGQGQPQAMTSDKRGGNPTPTTNNLLAWTYDAAFTVGAVASGPAAGVLTIARVPLESTGAINNILYSVSAAGAGLTSGACFLGVFDSAGNLLGTTADLSGVWNSTGSKTSALTAPTTVQAAGSVIYIAMLFNGTTAPLLRSSGNATMLNAGIVGSGNQRYGTVGTGLTTLPGTITPSSIATLAVCPWFGLN